MRIVIAIAHACLGCASVQSIESTTSTRLEASVEHKVVDDSLELSVATEVQGHKLTVAIEQQETCATLTTPRTHRRRYVDRRVDPTSSRATWTIAVLSIGAGVYGTVDADSLAAQSTAPDAPTAEQYRQYAGGLLVVGLAAATIGVIDGLRAGDSKYDDGIIRSETTRTEATCRRRASSNRDVALRLANGEQLTGRSDEAGKVTFDFAAVPEAGLPGDTTREDIAVGSARVKVALSYDQRAAIRSSLLAEPTSRLAVDILQKQRDSCARAVDNARGDLGTADLSRSVLASWRQVKADCGGVWTASYETELENVEARVVETECRNGLRAADEAFANGSDVTVEEMSTALASMRALCKAPEHVAKLSQLDAKLVKTIKRLEREAALEARRLAREQALQDALERARTQRSFPAPTWPTAPSSSCCKICSRGKACGNTCISRSKTCHVGVGCACDG
jgi:hypothetical protein